VPNGVDLPARVPAPATGKVLLFLGLLSFGPNSAAADHLVRDIWPLVHKALPDARLVVAGARPELLSSFKSPPPGVSFPGFVEDLERLYAEVALVCCPIRSGSGTRIKILEAAAWGRPVVSTTVGAEGLDFTDGAEILLRDDPREFAAACIALLQDRTRAQELARRARAVVEQKYVRRAVVDRIAGLIGGD
jgi:glycosyltransferase involved in cell wall biosynthesis